MKQVRSSEIWMLFSDADKRINVLIEECAHLQTTIFGFLNVNESLLRQFKSEPDPHYCGLPPNRLQDLKDAGFNRKVLLSVKKVGDYPGTAPRERALISLWNILGAAIVGLVSNQKLLRTRMERALAGVKLEASAEEADALQDLFWFLAYRGYLLNKAFTTYTELLEQAHEKIIQLQENRPGALPAPILFRRWNSAFQGEFLSGYARHVDWECRTIATRLRGHDFSRDNPDAQLSSVTHTWAHSISSSVIPVSVVANEDEHSGGRRRWRFGAIRSSFFYLEQPVLFPLLYHECAHLHFPNDADGATSGAKKFFCRRIEAYHNLGLGGIDVYGNYWDHYTEEIWADAVAIALSGRAYLGALALQLFAASGERMFSHHDLFEDQVFPLDTLGDETKKRVEEPIAGEDDLYFWEARLSIACLLSRALFPQCCATTSLAEGIEALVAAWTSGGSKVFDAARLSPAHREAWEYREALNNWVAETIWDVLQLCVAELRAVSPVSSLRLLSGKCVHILQTTISSANSQSHKPIGWLKPKSFRPGYIDEVAIDVLTLVARGCSERFSGNRPIGAADSFEPLKAMLKYERSFGAEVVTLALEWFAYRQASCEALADDKGQLAEIAGTTDSALVEALQEKIRRKEIFNSLPRADQRGDPELVGERVMSAAREEISNRADKVLEIVSTASRDGNCTPEVGTFCLGVLRSKEIARCSSSDTDQDLETPRPSSPYLLSMRAAERYLVANYAQADLAKANGVQGSKNESGASSQSAASCSFMPTIGEYQFAFFSPGTNANDRQTYPLDPMQMLVKPRTVMRVLGKGPVPPEGCQLGRISLIRFSRRTEVADLIDKVRKSQTCTEPTLFLSSGWEDVILVTWHRSDDEFWQNLCDLGLSVNNGRLDIQSSVIVPGLFAMDIAPKVGWQWNDRLSPCYVLNIKSALEAHNLVASVNNRMGRHDFTIVWKGDNSDISDNRRESIAVRCGMGLMSIPAGLWERIGHMTSSYEQSGEMKCFERTGSVHWAHEYFAFSTFSVSGVGS